MNMHIFTDKTWLICFISMFNLMCGYVHGYIGFCMCRCRFHMCIWIFAHCGMYRKMISKKKTGISLYRNKILWEFTRRINPLGVCYWYFVFFLYIYIYNLFYGCKFILLCNTFCECDTIIWVGLTWSFIDPSCVRGG
jgi:hypothetical protein